MGMFRPLPDERKILVTHRVFGLMTEREVKSNCVEMEVTEGTRLGTPVTPLVLRHDGSSCRQIVLLSVNSRGKDGLRR